jgi:hypothetical protein
VRLTLTTDAVTFASVGPELPINCEWVLAKVGGCWQVLAGAGRRWAAAGEMVGAGF